MHLQIDLLGGMAGDMFIAAALDAWPELADDTVAGIRSAGVSPDWDIAVLEFADDVFRGRRFLIGEPAGHDATHRHHRYEDIVKRLQGSRLDASVRDRAIAILELLGSAEAAVHGVDLAKVTFHEVGAWDSIGDVVGAAFLIEAIAPQSWSVGPIPLGGGRVDSAHGPLPLPAPAAALLLKGFALIDDGIAGERVTPTGAAILRHLADELGMPPPSNRAPMALSRVGTGFGTRKLPGISNIVRLLAFEYATHARIDDQVGVIKFEIDDQTAEDLAMGLDSLRESPGVLDVLQMPALGKKGRMVVHVQVLCRPRALQDVIDACFCQTTTLGLRWEVMARAKLDRDVVRSRTGGDTNDDPVPVKLARRPDGTRTAKAESESLRGQGGYLRREAIRGDAERSVLASEKPDD